MKNTTTSLIKPMLALGLAAAALLTATSSRAGLNLPYTNNATTLHLWHFDGGLTNGSQPLNVLSTDAVAAASGGLTLTNQGMTGGTTNTASPAGAPPYTNIELGITSYAGLSNCIYFSNYTVGVANYAFASGGTNENGSHPFVNSTTGAFTYEALVKMTVNPFTTLTHLEVICGDNQALAGGRGWQFRINTGPTAPTMEVNALSFAGPSGAAFGSGGGGGGAGDYLCPLPSSGPDAVAAGQWYHMAMTYTGYSPTNGDTAGILTFYWTLLDPNRTNADVLTNFTLTGTLGTLGGNPWIAVGGSGRTQTGIGNGEGFKGYIDEARMSSVCLKSTNMAFSTVGTLNPPSFSQEPATNSLIGYGNPLSLSTLATGTLPISYQWQQNAGSGYTNITNPIQTNNQLSIPAVTFAAGGNYQLIATNAYGAATSTVAQVTIGSSPYGLFGTGLNAAGVEADGTAPGTADLNYTLVQSADTGNLGSNAIVWGDAAPLASGGGIFANDDPTSAWIGPEQNAGQTDGTYWYNTSFVVDGAVPSTVTLQGTVFVDTALTGVLLNGVSTGISDYIATAEKFGSTFTITNGFVQGLNTMQFQVSETTGDFTALRVAMSAVGQALSAGLPTILSNPAPASVEDYLQTATADSVGFSVVAVGRPPMTYQWHNAANGSTAITTAFQNSTPVTTNRTLFLQNASGQEVDPTNFYCVVANASGSVTSTVGHLIITQADVAPVAPSYTNTTLTNTALTYNVSTLLNSCVSPVDNVPLTFSGFTTPGTGGGVITQTGVTLTYQPPTNYTGADSFTYTVLDDQSSSGTGTLYINVVASVVSNTPPVLPAQSNLTNNELVLLTVTNTATESNGQATITGYGLVSPPAGAAISTNGIITWTPSQAESPSTNTITTVVTNSDPSDSVNPQLTATNSFIVVVKEVNVAPTLSAKSNLTVNALALLTVTNAATNSNIHATNTGYVLVSPPAGAAISASGIITWTPAVNQGGSTNTITTVVTNGDPFDTVNPHLTATNSFKVVVNVVAPPVLSSAVLSGGNLVLGGSGGSPNGTYDVLTTTNVATPLTNWTDLATTNFDGSGNFHFTNAVSTNPPNRYFRIRVP